MAAQSEGKHLYIYKGTRYHVALRAACWFYGLWTHPGIHWTLEEW